MIVAVTKDHRLRVREDVAHWKLLPGDNDMLSVTVLPNGTLLAVKFGGLYSRATLTSAWKHVPEVGAPMSMESVVALPDGVIIGAYGGDGGLYYKMGLDEPWSQVTGDRRAIRSLAAGGSQSFFGVGRDGCVYRRDGFSDDWRKLEGSAGVLAVTVLPDGTLLGVNQYNKLSVWLTLAERWKDISGPADVELKDLTVLPDGSILGIGTDFRLYIRAHVPATGWRPMNLGTPHATTLAALTVLPDGTFVGLDTAGQLHKNAGHSVASWEALKNRYPVLAVTVSDRLMGVGTDKWVYQWDDLAADPIAWEFSRGVSGVTMLPDGRVIGITSDYLHLKDNQLCVRVWKKNIGRPGHIWVWTPFATDPVNVKSVTTLPDGRLLGVGLNNNELYIRDISPEDLYGTWELVIGGGPVTSVSALPDGSLLGIGTDGQAYVWKDFLPSTWRTIPVRGGLELQAVTAGPNGNLLGVTQRRTLCTVDQTSGAWEEKGGGQVIGATVLTDGRIVGVSDGNTLLVRESLKDDWTGTGDVGKVQAVATMPDGSLVGVGMDNTLCTRSSLLTNGWEPVLDSGAVRSVSVLPNGTILAVGSDFKLYTRTALTGGGWHVVPDTDTAPDNDKLLAVTVLPDDVPPPPGRSPFAVSERPADWLLEYTSTIVTASDGDGRPWGDGTAMARRARTGAVPWDHGSLVTPMVGGFDTLGAIREVFEAAIADADEQAARKSPVPPGQRGHVYVAGWLVNGLRDLSETNPWKGGTWAADTWDRKKPVTDQTALGLILRMMAAGIRVRIMLWMPTTAQAQKTGEHAPEHWNVAAAIQDYNNRLGGTNVPLGVVALDMRTANAAGTPSVASLHQKMIVVRVGAVNVGFCGGVDLAFTRRDFGSHGRSETGDWQSGAGVPTRAAGWPHRDQALPGGYPAYPYDPADPSNKKPFPEDLPENAYGKGNRRWHDQHLKLEGPVVASLEDQFAERWIIDTTDWDLLSPLKGRSERVFVFDRDKEIGRRNQVQMTSVAALVGTAKGHYRVLPLPETLPVAPVGDATVQMWRTIPMYPERTIGPFVRGEFTILAGVAKAISQARHLITIWDQFFWSKPLAKLLANQLTTNPGLRLLIVLPPYGTANPISELGLRLDALQELWNGLKPEARTRVMVRNTWDKASKAGIYLHDKVQTYDDALLVCGSANMNRRSFECDAELDCAVLHAPTVRGHLARLYTGLAGEPWVDFGPGWFDRYWLSFNFGIAESSWFDNWLIKDQFFQAKQDIKAPQLPNGTPIPTEGDWGIINDWVYDPTCFASNLATPPPDVELGDKKGRLDGITYLLEKFHLGDYWRFRFPQGGS